MIQLELMVALACLERPITIISITNYLERAHATTNYQAISGVTESTSCRLVRPSSLDIQSPHAHRKLMSERDPSLSQRASRPFAHAKQSSNHTAATKAHAACPTHSRQDRRSRSESCRARCPSRCRGTDPTGPETRRTVGRRSSRLTAGLRPHRHARSLQRFEKRRLRGIHPVRHSLHG